MDAEKRGTFADWMKIPFERLHQATDFDDYACSPPDATEFMGSCETPIAPLAKNKHVGNRDKLNLLSKLNEDSFQKSGSYSGKPISGPVADIFTRQGVSAPSSKEVSPCVTPQGSPFSSRKAVTPNEDSKCNNANTKKWFYSGFFGSEITDGSSNCHYTEAKSGKSTFRKFHVSNFDINVVGPTSW